MTFNFLTNARIDFLLNASHQNDIHTMISSPSNRQTTKEAKYPFLCSSRRWDQSSWPQWKWWAALTSSSTDTALWSWMFPLYELRDTSWASQTTRGLCRRMLRQDLVWRAIVDCVDVRIMFARRLGQNIMSHDIWSEVDGCTAGVWWAEEMHSKYMFSSKQSVGHLVHHFSL